MRNPDTEETETAETAGEETEAKRARGHFNAQGAKHGATTSLAIHAFQTVYNTLGTGFREQIYHAAMIIELQRLGAKVASELPIPVYYRGTEVGVFFADLVVNDAVILELKAGRELHDEHRAQLLNYLKASKFEVGLLFNFGETPRFERKVYDNNFKGSLKWITPERPSG